MVVETNRKVTQLGINKLYFKTDHKDEMTKKNGFVKHQISLEFQYSTP